MGAVVNMMLVCAVLGSAFLAFNTMTMPDRQLQADQFAVREPAPRDSAVHKLSDAVQFATVSYEREEAPWNYTAFDEMHKWMVKAFPRVHATLKREFVNTYSLLYTWQGSDASLKPVILMAHQDVVPVDHADDWEFPEFGGMFFDDEVTGRGSIDTKSSLVGTMEGVELLLEQGYTPKRTVYLAFGHDEEVQGLKGAKQIARVLKERGVHAEALLDEGGVVTDGVVSGVSKPVAVVGIGEKGFLNVNLTIQMKGGHSSMPREGENPIVALVDAVQRLQASPPPARLSEASAKMFEFLAPHVPMVQRVVMSNPVLEPLLVQILKAKPSTNALLRTTMAPTLFHAGQKSNVVPQVATANINFRIRHGDSMEDVLAYVRRVVADERVQVKSAGGNNPSRVSRVDVPAFESLHQAIREYWPESIVAPYLVVGGTDCKHYEEVADNLYRFTPFKLTDDGLKRIHGQNEKLNVSEFERAVSFYARVLELWSQA